MRFKEELLTLSNGTKFAFVKTEGFYSAKFKITFACGAEDEPNAYGIAHLVEHGVFKGTDTLSQEEISVMFNKLSADPDASTSSEFTSYKARFPKRNLEEVLKLYSDIIFNSNFDEKLMEKEKRVIIEEIKMHEDMPEQACFDNLIKNMFQDIGIGYDIGGEIPLLKKVTREDLLNFRDSRYNSENAYIYVIGDYDKAQVVQLLEKHIVPKLKKAKAGTVKKWSKKSSTKGGIYTKFKPIEQANVMIAFKSLPFEDFDRLKLATILYILGGSMSSRLFERIRNQLSLCYSIYAFDVNYKNNGFFGISFASDISSAQLAVKEIKNELKKILTEGVTQEEFIDAKNMSIDKHFMRKDHPSANLAYLAYTGNLIDEKLVESTIKKMTKKECEDVFRKVVDLDCCYLSYVGKKTKIVW